MSVGSNRCLMLPRPTANRHQRRRSTTRYTSTHAGNMFDVYAGTHARTHSRTRLHSLIILMLVHRRQRHCRHERRHTSHQPRVTRFLLRQVGLPHNFPNRKVVRPNTGRLIHNTRAYFRHIFGRIDMSTRRMMRWSRRRRRRHQRHQLKTK